MSRKRELKMREMTLKERVRFILLCLLSITILTGALVFFGNVCGAEIISLLTGADIIYYNWRVVFILLYFPVVIYFDIFALLLLLTPFTLYLARLWHRAINIVSGYIILAFFLAFLLSLYISFFFLADYHSCDMKGPFSGVHYVKDLKMCKQLEYHPENDKSDDATPVIPADTKIK
ncbi:DUF1240 domain-containing protein [Salmonella enterica]|nr:DUF1240 domain-containing protein [Salmonella enterica]